MDRIIRPLSIHEASFPVYGELCPGAGNIVVCLKLTGELSLLQAQQGFTRLMQAEPSLQVASEWSIGNKSEGIKPGYVFVKPEHPKVPFTSSEVPSDDFEKEVTHVRTSFLNQPFQEGGLLWRAHLISQKNDESHLNSHLISHVSNDVNQHCIMLCINHSVSDGSSVTQLMKQWLLALEHPKNNNGVERTLKQPLWHYMPKKIASVFGAFRTFGVLSTFIKAQKLAEQGLSFKAECNVPISEHRCGSTYRTLNTSAFSKLLARSKNNNKSIHGLVSAALMQVLLTDCKNNGQLNNIKPNFLFPFVTTVNVRDKIIDEQQGDQGIKTHINGCFSSGVTSMVKVDQSLIDTEYQDSPWALGDQVSTGVKAALKQDQHWKVLRIYQLAGLKGLKKMFIDSSEKPLATPISFANLGAVHFAASDDLRTSKTSKALEVNGYQAYAAFHASGAGVNVVASSLNTELTLCFTCPSPVIAPSTLHQYADDVLKLLEHWSH